MYINRKHALPTMWGPLSYKLIYNPNEYYSYRYHEP